MPPLNYEFVKKISERYPNILFVLNGGIEDLNTANSLLNNFKGVMLGRLIQNNPFILRKIDNLFLDDDNIKNVDENIIYDYFSYIEPKIKDESIFRLLSPLLSIFLEFQIVEL